MFGHNRKKGGYYLTIRDIDLMVQPRKLWIEFSAVMTGNWIVLSLQLLDWDFHFRKSDTLIITNIGPFGFFWMK